MTPNNENSVIGQTELTEIIETEIAEHGGSISFARFMELALYHPRFGYYMSGRRRPGRGGDFITSPEATPLFGHALARQMAEFWERLGQPGQWTIREYGAGIGGLAYDILAGLSQLSESAFDSLTYRLAEVSPAMRREAESSMREAGLSHKIIVEDPAGTRLSPILGVVLANEVADAFPAIRLTLEEDGWREQHVTSGSQGFAWCSKPPSTGARSVIDMLENEGVELPVGSVVDASPAASAWFEAVAESLDRGFAMVIDYGYPAQTLYRDHRLQGTIRGYHGHTVTDDPLMRVGLQDLTAHVDFTALQQAGERAGLTLEGFTTQGAMLSSLDLGAALMQLHEDPGATMQEYLATQAVVLRLIDPGGLGRFGVLIMSRGVPPSKDRLRAFRDAPPSF